VTKALPEDEAVRVPDSAHEQGLGHTIGRISTLLSSGATSPGDRAGLRRMQPGRQPPLVWYQFAVVAHLDALSREGTNDWMTVVAGMALMGSRAHDVSTGFGTSLARSGYSALRLERLLSAEGQTKRLLTLRAARFLAAHSTATNWVQAATLLMAREPDKQDAIRERVATDFYRHTIN
jgi:CRISPR type I-E-associated protein CasB/Cse2